MTVPRRLFSALAMSLGALLWVGSVAAAPAHAPSPHVLGIRCTGPCGPPPPGGSKDLTYHGGSVETATVAYISLWGSPRTSPGLTTGRLSGAQAQTYVTGFFVNIGWPNSIVTGKQYCQQ